jgi:hypothetical protein
MLYIPQDRRKKIEALLTQVADEISLRDSSFWDGELNFAISYLVSDVMKPLTGWRYHWIARAYAVFLMAGAEFYRRVAIPYEDKAVELNDDLPFYREI